MKKIVLLCLVIVCITISLIPGVSSAQQGKFPIQVIDDTARKTSMSEAVKNAFINRVQNSSQYRLGIYEEDRMIIRFIVGGYQPITSDWKCVAQYVNIIGISWCAKPKNRALRYLSYNWATFHSANQVADDFMKDTDRLYNSILNDYSYFFIEP